MRTCLLILFASMLAACDTNFSAKRDLPVSAATDVAPEQYRAEFENDWVKIIRVKYAPGESSEMHSHNRMIGIHLTAMSSLYTDADGVVEKRDAAAFIPFETSDDDIHAQENLLASATESVLIELKASYQPTIAESPNGFDSNPNSRQLLLGGEGYRVFKTTYKKGMQMPLHSHNAKVAVFVTDAHFLTETLEGGGSEQMIAAGQARWGDETSHKVSNLGEAFEVLVVELL